MSLLELAAPRFCYVGKDLFAGLERHIEEATSEILFALFTFHHDSVGLRFLDLLGEAAARGVRVRVIFDNVFSADGAAFAQMLAQRGIEIRPFRPFWRMTFFHPVSFVCRNHARLFLFDRRYFATGGFGIGERSFDRDDFGAFFEVADASGLVQVFEHLWNLAEGVDVPLRGSPRMPLLPEATACYSGPGLGFTSYQWLLEAVRFARERIWIMTPFFFVPRQMRVELVRALERGVAVRLITPRQTDKPYYDRLAAPAALFLARQGAGWCAVPKYFHGKLFLADHRWAFGSSNFDLLSFQRSYELDLCGEGSDIEKVIEHTMEEAVWKSELRNSYDLPPALVRHWQAAHRFLEAVFSIV